MRPEIKALIECPVEELDDAEIETIASIRSTGAVLLNATDGGTTFHPFLGQLVSRKLKGRKQTPETIAKAMAGKRRKNAIQKINNYAYCRSWRDYKKAELIADFLERFDGVKMDDPWVKDLLTKINGDGRVATTVPPYSHPVETC